MTRFNARGALLLTILFASGRTAGAQPRQSGATAGLGTVHFPTSCRAEVAPRFDRAVALLHSFEFGEAIGEFEGVLAVDSTCAMAQWGIALSRWTNPLAPTRRTAAVLAPGRRAVDAAQRLAGGATERERGYIAAVAQLYADFEHTDQQSRVAAYERGMAALVAAQPADTEARIFHALALLATVSPGDKTYATQLRAGAILESLWVAQPDHPGLAHYIIHSYDVPALAPRAASAARRYAEIAPATAHALHMPSHTFTRLGLWEESAAANRRSVAAARREASAAEELHASDYLEYAYLQMRRDAAARAVVDGLPAIAARFDPTAITGAAPGSAGVFALAAIPARYALERRAWTEAAALVPTTSAYPYAEAMTWFARALGAAHLGREEAARDAVDSLGAIEARLQAGGDAYWAGQVAIQRLGAQAWLDLGRGDAANAVEEMSEAATREDATEKSIITPGPLAPAHELLADMLMELHRPAEALVQYRATLAREPRRYRALEGARRAAMAAGDAVAAARYAAELRQLVGNRQR